MNKEKRCTFNKVEEFEDLEESKQNKIHNLFVQEFGPMEEDTIMSFEKFHAANIKLLSKMEEDK